MDFPLQNSVLIFHTTLYFYFLITYGVCKKRKYCNRISYKKKKKFVRLSVSLSVCTYVCGLFMWTQ